MALKYDITGDNHYFLTALEECERGVRDTTGVIESQGGNIEATFKRIQTAAAASLAGFSAQAFIRQAASVRGEFQKLEVAFSTMLESEEKADALMQQLTKTAAITPFDLKGVADGAKQLMAYGVAADEVNDTLIHLGDIAAGLSLPLGDLVYLYGTTITQGRMFTQDLRQFMGRGIPLADELAKQFGVTKDKVGELVTAGKVGADEFKKAIMAMSSEGGKFGGLMEKQSKTITGQISNIEDAIDVMFNEIGKKSEGAINASLDLTATLVENWEAVGAAILAAAETYGIYKATLMTMTAYNGAVANISYDAEIAALQQLLPLKQQQAATDLEQAVASGNLTAEKAAQIAALREEAKAHIENLAAIAAEDAAKAESAAHDLLLATNRDAEAQRSLNYYENQYEKILETGDAFAIEQAELELNTAASTKNATAKELQAATEAHAAAQSKANASAKAVETAQTNLDTAATAGNTAATGILAQAKLALKRAIDAVNASFLASPLFWIAAVITGVTFAVYALVTAESDQEKATRKANEALEEQNKLNEERKQKVQGLLRTIQDKNATELEQLKAYEEMKTLVPDITDRYSQEALAAMKAADSQKELNEQLENQEYEEAKKKAEEYRKEVERLRKVVGDGTPSLTAMYQSQYTGRNEQVTAKRQLPLAEENLRVWETKVREIERLQDEIAEKQRPIEIRLKEARENEAVRQRIFDFYDEAMVLTHDWQRANETIDYSSGKTRLDEFIENAEKDLADLREKQEKDPVDLNLRMEAEEKQKILNELLTMKSNWTSMGALNLPFTFSVNYASAQSALEAARQKAAGLAAQQANTPTLADAYNKAQTAYNNAKALVDKMQKNRSAYTQEQWDKAQQDLKDAKTTYNGLGGDTTDKSKKDASTRQQRLKEQQRYNELERRLAVDRQRTSVDLQFSTDQAVIDAMEDGSKKTLAQIQLDYRKQKEEIQRGYEDLKQQKIDNARQLFEANPANKDKVFDPSKVNTDYTDEETANYEAQMRANEETYQRSLRDQQNAQRQALLDYIKEYGSIQDQKLAIAKEYEQRIAKEQGIIQKRALEAERDRTLSELDMKELQQSINWEDVFGDLSRKSVSSLRQLRDRLRQALDTKDITVENAQILSDKIAEIGNAITDKTDILASILPGLRERKRLTEQATAAEELYRKALEKEAESINKVLADKREIQDLLNEAQIRDAFGQKITVELEAISEENKERLLASLDKDSDLYKKLLELFENLAADVTDQNNNHATSEAKRSYAKELKDSLNDGNFKQILSNLFNFEGMGFTEIASLVNTNAQSLSDFIDKIGLENTDFGQAVHGFADGVSGFNNAIQSLANGDVFGAVNGVLDGIAGFGRMGAIIFGGSGNEDDMEAEIANLSKANENLAMAIEKLSQRISDKSSTNSQSLEAYREALAGEKDWQKNQLEAINARASEWTNTGYGFLGLGGKSSFNAHMAGNDWYGWDKFDEVLKKHFGESGIEHNSVNRNTIWELTPEEMSLLQQFAPKEWQALMNGDGHRNPQDLVNEYIERAGMIESLTSALNEKLTGYSWDSFLDSYKSLLKDLDSTTEDFADHIQELITNALIEAFVNGEAVQGKIKDLYKKIAQYASEDSAGGTDLTADEINDIKAANEDIANTLLAWREAAKQAGLITSSNEEPYEQEATKGAWQGMSEDTGQELNGRFTALQVAGENISNQMTLAVTQINLITGFTQSSNHYLMDIRNSIIMGNTYLEDIAKYSKAIYSEFASKLDTIANNTKY
jgi:tape measure domain-containing protein